MLHNAPRSKGYPASLARLPATIQAGRARDWSVGLPLEMVCFQPADFLYLEPARGRKRTPLPPARRSSGRHPDGQRCAGSHEKQDQRQCSAVDQTVQVRDHHLQRTGQGERTAADPRWRAQTGFRHRSRAGCFAWHALHGRRARLRCCSRHVESREISRAIGNRLGALPCRPFDAKFGSHPEAEASGPTTTCREQRSCKSY